MLLEMFRERYRTILKVFTDKMDCDCVQGIGLRMMKMSANRILLNVFGNVDICFQYMFLRFITKFR